MQNLFLRQSYLDSWEDYNRSINKENFIRWDYLILTASNEAQAEIYREQIQYRLDNHLIPEKVHYAVLPDPEGKRVGSGGATFHALRYIADREKAEEPFKGRRIMVIHSGGDSKRVPQYSACGKLFSPVPRELPNGETSTLFDEFIIGMSGVPARIKEGMLVLSGDVLLLFNPLQIDSQFDGAAAISIKEHVNTGKNHGVFLNDGNDNVAQFLHKQTEYRLRELGAVNTQDKVDLDTGAILMDCSLLHALYSLISTNGKPDEVKYSRFVNEKARLSFYGDFLYPLAGESTLEQYYKETAEGQICEELLACRKEIWEAIHHYNMKLLHLSPAEFIHFGTTRELLQLLTETIGAYEFLDWKRLVGTNWKDEGNFAIHNSFISKDVQLSDACYVEDSYLGKGVELGKHSVVSGIEMENETIPPETVFHGLKLGNGKYVVRAFGVEDNPKSCLADNPSFMGTNLKNFMDINNLSVMDLWDEERQGEEYLWFAKLYPACSAQKDALDYAVMLCRMAKGTASKKEIQAWKACERLSLYSSFNAADMRHGLRMQKSLENRILVDKFLQNIRAGIYYKEANKVFGTAGLNIERFRQMIETAEKSDFSDKIRIFYDLSRIMKENRLHFDGKAYDALETMCFHTIQNEIFQEMRQRIVLDENCRIQKENVEVKLPVRINLAGGWTDTPPYCNEQGGAVLNAAISLRGKLPICAEARRLKELRIVFESVDFGAKGSFTELSDIQDCHNPYDPFVLHKATLIACGIIPMEGGGNLVEILRRLGGGIYLSTRVIGVPKGSGLGTSSILAGACAKAIYHLLGRDAGENELYDIVLGIEQIMSTGGGWQDQVGGLTPGIKCILSKPGIRQDIRVHQLDIAQDTLKELSSRFVLIYTGQRRLARNLLRDVVGNYIGGRKESVDALYKMKRMVPRMCFELEEGNLDSFANLLDEHWELSKQLDQGSTNTCIDQIFQSCEDLLAARFICGAGGGGFLQVLLKKGVTKEQLQKRLRGVFEDSGVEVWDCEVWMREEKDENNKSENEAVNISIKLAE
ncbi:MAG: L-fucokinase [Eubacteriales bacterium]|nr:L-fucokinase [Eubacteriales bacterium]